MFSFSYVLLDWHDARHIPLKEGPFTLDDYIDYVMAMIDLPG
jgi:poly(3-hydroxybutyrate) depolymerase